MEQISSKLGISLSGGGYRAAAFHLGTLKKLEDMGILKDVEVISSISGGSITGAYYCIHEGIFNEFYEKMYDGFQRKNVIKNVLLSWFGLRLLFFVCIFLSSFYVLFTSFSWIFPIIITCLILLILKFQFLLFPISKRIEQVYDSFFFHKKTLRELKDKPTLVIGATNLQTAKPFVFTKTFMQDSTYQFMDNPIEFLPTNFPISRAVIASSCVPFAFTPITIDKKFYSDHNEANKVHPILVDGGVYDNQGMHKIMQTGRFACDIIITSDAGGSGSGELQFKNTVVLLKETVNVFMSRIKKQQMMRNVYDNASGYQKQIAYFSLGWDMENCIGGFITNLEKKQITKSVVDAHELLNEWIENPNRYRQEITKHLHERVQYDSIIKPSSEEKRTARTIGTNLTSLSKNQVDCLIKQAQGLTELQVKLYCPYLLK